MRKNSAPEHDWHTLWYATRRTACSSLAIVPIDEGVGAGSVAAQLVATGQRLGDGPVSLMSAEGIGPSEVQPFIDRLRDATRRGLWVIVVVDPILHNAGGLQIAKASSGALLVVDLGRSIVDSAREVINALGREHLIGSVVIDRGAA